MNLGIQFLSSHRAAVAGAPIIAAANTNQPSTIVELEGSGRGLCFLVPITSSVVNGVAKLIHEQGDVNNDAAMAPTEAQVSVTSLANGDLDGQVLALEIAYPTKLFHRVRIQSQTAAIAFGAPLVIHYGYRKKPARRDATEIVFVSPEEV